MLWQLIIAVFFWFYFLNIHFCAVFLKLRGQGVDLHCSSVFWHTFTRYKYNWTSLLSFRWLWYFQYIQMIREFVSMWIPSKSWFIICYFGSNWFVIVQILSHPVVLEAVAFSVITCFTFMTARDFCMAQLVLDAASLARELQIW